MIKEEIDRLSMYENKEALTISGLTQETFEYFIKKILDEDISFVAKMPNLECFDFNPNLFETEKIAWVMANCPEIKGSAFHIFVDDYMYNKESLEFDIPTLRLPGRGKRCFVATDIGKKNKLQKEFVQMMDKYRGKDYYDIFK